MEMIIVTLLFVALFASAPWALRTYAGLKISVFQASLISISGVLTFIAAGIFMGEPLPPFPEWGVLGPYWGISFFGFIIFSASIYLATNWQQFLKYSWLVIGYPVLFSASMYITTYIYTAST